MHILFISQQADRHFEAVGLILRFSRLSCHQLNMMTDKPTSAISQETVIDGSFSPFSLERLLRTVFGPKGGERVAILIDLEDPSAMKGMLIWKMNRCPFSERLTKYSIRVWSRGQPGIGGWEMFAYRRTGGSNGPS